MLTNVLRKLDGEDSKVPPSFDQDLPTFVECAIYVDSFDSISEASMDYTVSLLLHMVWNQPGLKYLYDVPYFEVDPKNMEKIWIPDLYFPNEKKAAFHNVMMPNKMMRIYPDGSLSYYARLSLTFSCPMNLRFYPFDKQVCALQMESFGFDSEKVVLEWANTSTPVDINEQIVLPQFQVTNKDSRECDHSRPRIGEPDGDTSSSSYALPGTFRGSFVGQTALFSDSGNHSCLQATFHLERNIQYYIVQMYIPSILIVVVSWISFWLTVTSVAGRISLGVLTVLTMTTQSSGVNASLPRVSYTKAIDIWMSTCLMFVFAALIEFAVVNVLSRNERLKMIRRGTRQIPDDDEYGNVAITREIRETIVNMDGDVRLSAHQKRRFSHVNITGIQVAMCLDNFSRVMFPFAFMGFNTFYWLTYLVWGAAEEPRADGL
ncbi:glycine receptor subunit alpha-2-like [Gigantopelta aegis]|uniref:glycine receptor subunit alpha-2-like n=1 Tax=Gigantopelta aegis TaxID=1735272 RepID=UPI001B88C6AB|nr:glycine receptor subunit alpha-2-like [Gigantopelta aegis]